MSEIATDIAAIHEEIDAVRNTLSQAREEALADDGMVDEEEAAEISDLEDQVDYLRSALRDLESQLARQDAAQLHEGEDEAGFLSGVMNGIQEMLEGATDAVSDAVTEDAEQSPGTYGAGTEDAGATGEPGRTGAVGRDNGTAADSRGGGSSISASVGSGGHNEMPDVSTIQTLLNRAGAGLAVDGLVGPKTIGGIRAFQEGNGCPASGVIAPGDETWSVLKAGGRAGQLAEAARGAAESAGSWVEDAAGAVAGTLGDMADSVVDLVSGEDDEEEIQRIHDELVELELEAEAL